MVAGATKFLSTSLRRQLGKGVGLSSPIPEASKRTLADTRRRDAAGWRRRVGDFAARSHSEAAGEVRPAERYSGEGGLAHSKHIHLTWALLPERPAPGDPIRVELAWALQKAIISKHAQWQEFLFRRLRCLEWTIRETKRIRNLLLLLQNSRSI